MISSVFPDLNVWMALTLRAHEHHSIAWNWYKSLSIERELVFCRLTQIGFLRLLTTESVAKHETLNQLEAWAAYDKWLEKGGCVYLPESLGVDLEFRFYANRTVPAPREWGGFISRSVCRR